MTKKIITLLVAIITITMTNSCSKLTEKVLDEGSVAGLTEKQQAEGIIAPVYAKLEDVFLHTGYFDLQEISTDEAILPFRGGTDWGDNGIYNQMHKHETISSDVNIRATWNNILIGLSRAVTAISAGDQQRSQCKSVPGGSKGHAGLLFFTHPGPFRPGVRKRRCIGNIKNIARR
jgi:hypothetical protein